MRQPEVHYTRAGEAEIAYSVVGDGPVDLVWAFGLMTHLEVKWEEPALADLLDRLAGFCRLVLFDRRGCGLSDRGDRFLGPTLEERVADVEAVLDAVGSTRVAVLGVSEGSSVAALLASTRPELVERIVLYGGLSRLLRDDEHPWGLLSPEELQAQYGPVFEQWGTTASAAAQVRLIAPSAAEDPDYVAWFARQQRLALSRDAVGRFMRTVVEYDLDDVLPAVRVPTLVLHRTGDTAVPTSHAERVAARIPTARLVELPGADHLPYVGTRAEVDALVAAVRDFLGEPAAPDPVARQLLTLLAVDAPDAPDAPDRATAALARRRADRFDGTEVAVDGGGRAVRFPTATAALRCGLALAGDGVRVGVHTGECEVAPGRVSGPASRLPGVLAAHARPGQVLATSTVRDVVAGSGLGFAPGPHLALPGDGAERQVLVASEDDVVPGPAATSSAAPEAVLRPDGEYWTASFEGRVVTLRDSRGLHDLRALLAEPGRERHALDLWSATAGTAPATPAPAEPVLDDVARERFRRHLADLDEAIESAVGRDDDTAERLRAEREQVVAQVGAAYGLGGRSRRVPDEAERARKAVRRRLADALARVEHAHPPLGRHLRASVRTGLFCCYEPEREVRWDLGPAARATAGRD